MTPVVWMAAASVASWLVTVAVVEPRVRLDVFLGMLGPLAAATVSWVVAECTYRLRPDRLTAVMIGAFAVKVVFFGAYVALVVGTSAHGPFAFIMSFVGYLTGLYLMEAVYLRRLFR